MDNKKVALVIPHSGFDIREYQVTKDALEAAGHSVTTFSNQAGNATSSDEQTVKVNSVLEKLDPEQFDALIFIGGETAAKNLDNDESYRILREAHHNKKIIGAIDMAPRILARAEILGGKRATGFNENNLVRGLFEQCNVTFVDEQLVTHEHIITAQSADMAEQFIEKIIDVLAHGITIIPAKKPAPKNEPSDDADQEE